MRKKWFGIAAATAVSAAAMITGISAYLTDKENKANTFTVGNVDIDLNEENWLQLPRSEDTNDDGVIDENDIPDEAAHMYPTQKVVKDPSVLNQGTNPAWIYLQVTVPKAEVITADSDGKRQNDGKAVLTQLYEYEADETEWTLLKENTDAVNANVYLYGVKSPVEVGAQTVPLFQEITLVNVIEGQLDPEKIQMIDIKAFAIQSDNTGTNLEAWNKYVNQADDQIKEAILVKE